VLFVRLGALGDIVHAVPAALAVAAAVPAAEIDWLVDRRHRAVLDLFDLPVRPIEIGRGPNRGGGASAFAEASADRRSLGGGWLAPLDFVRTIRALRKRAYDAALDLQGLIKSATCARLSGAPRVIGFARHVLREPLAGLMYTEAVDPGVYGHVIQKNVALAGAIGERARTPTSIVMPLKPTAPAVGGSATPYAIVNPGAGWPNKRWAPERFGAVADRIRRDHGLDVLVTWGPGEESLARAVVDASSGGAQPAPRTGLHELLALVRGAQLVVSGDTGPLHLAAAAATPVVALFGPTDPRRNGPWASDDMSVSEFHRCICHHKRRCSRATRCLDDIGVDDVMGAVATRLTRAGAVKR
jgi:heptosyltransferase-1